MSLIKPNIIECDGDDADLLEPCLAEWIESQDISQLSCVRDHVIMQIIDISYDEMCNVYTLYMR